ncbi:MAG: hypothetical protein RL148_1039 [Planctomycetota bacterium]|jgi:chromosomal replication initiator protein
MVESSVPEQATRNGSATFPTILRELVHRVRREQFETWFRSLSLVRVSAQEAEFSVTSNFVRDWVQKNYTAQLQDAVAAALGERRKVVLTLREEDNADARILVALPPLESTTKESSSPREPGPREPVAAAMASAARGGSHDNGALEQSLRRRLQPSHLNPNYTFDKFVVGSCNRLAHAAAIAISENPGFAYNPLFLHGNVGLGKTHLMQAICHTVMRRDPNARVLYMSCEDFTNTFIQAIQSGNLDQFREFHRSVDVLVIDDVQFLANKEKTQDEFFHTFNALYDAQKQIVISSDRPPVEIPTVEERLVSRFKWGLVAQIEAPCFDTRAAIVRRKAKGRGAEFGDDVAALIAERVTNNIRELEGAVIKVLGLATITGRPVTVELAEEALRGVALPRQTQVSAEDVMTLITSEFAISGRDLTGKSRTQAVSSPRQIAMFLLRDHTDMSLEDIGRLFGNRDHTTVLYAVNKIRERSQTDRMFKEMLDGLGGRLVARTRR